MKLVCEDEHGAYLGVSKEFLKEFILKESNPNFEVFDSKDKYRRFIAVKSSRIPDDQDLAAGKYGIDFNRAKPELKEALQYGIELTDGFKWLSDIAFAALNEEEYERKSSIWEDFYSYIWDLTPQTVWIAPHSGSVNRAPDDLLLYPKTMIDTCTAGVAASCAFNDRNTALKRIMIAIHATGMLGAVLNLGDFGVADEEKMDIVAKKIELKYHERAQSLADKFKHDFCSKTINILENINKKRETLDPEKLDNISYDEAFNVRLYVKGLRLYGLKIKEFTIMEFKQALQNLSKIEVPVISNNYLHTGRNVGKLLKLSKKIELGLLYSALNIECSRIYIANDPELISNMILDVKNELFD